MIYIGYKVKADVPGIDQAPEVYAFYIRRHLDKLGDALREEIRSEQRQDTGQERSRTQYKVTTIRGGMSFRLLVFNSVVQALVDETGARPHFPPYRKGSKLYAWVRRHGLADETQVSFTTGGHTQPVLDRKGAPKVIKAEPDEIERVSFLVARAISRRGLPRPGDVLRAPFKDVYSNRRDLIARSFTTPFALATARINAVDRKGGVSR